ncbi:amidohydrolase family protein [Aestuariirhabdus sp. Z084]|uniref:amidohydrolase family protein n=1 Tax=Aestuariirhabdus haliotis TaxID=2918751 RepID=UPI00201B3EA7|nr:amidohydrolase family protein [Aestuariirhabdus haliotis]MCL6416697.1 amidohydrolase family protein [Aestuariirhabdus haliotis]MCL6420714.1 amidohydrolase family protein [Aestuariirhabdus haliotis]
MRYSLFDAHLHIIDSEFPLTANQGYLPAPYSVSNYRQEIAGIDIAGGAVVSGSFQGFDQGYLVAALKHLGPDFVGVTQLPISVKDDELLYLDRCGVRAVRFNVRRGGSEELGALAHMALRVYELCGWHVELYIDAAELSPLLPLLADLPCFSIDHLGLSQQGLPQLLRAVELGAKVKASGFGRVTLNVEEALQQIHQLDPTALMFGSDLPGTRAPRRFQRQDLDRIVASLGEEAAEAVFRTNAEGFYRTRPSPAGAE